MKRLFHWPTNVSQYTTKFITYKIESKNLVMICYEPSRHSSVRIASAWSHTVRQWWHYRSQFQAPPMLAHMYVEENGLAAMLASKRG